jgi:hypothetical protein
LASERLTPDGVLAYNVIGSLRGHKAGLLASVVRTMQEAFPQVHLFPASESLNVVLLATRKPERRALPELQQRAGQLIRQRTVTLPGFLARLQAMQDNLPPSVGLAPILTDDHAPVEALSR